MGTLSDVCRDTPNVVPFGVIRLDSRLQEVRPGARRALPAQITWVIAPPTPAGLG
jgi:hypothetical protein